jgi:hypothetical protein
MNENDDLTSPSDPSFPELVDYVQDMAHYAQHTDPEQQPKLLNQIQWQINKYLYMHNLPSTDYENVGSPPPCPKPPCP